MLAIFYVVLPQILTEAMHESRHAQSELYVQAWPYSCHGQSAGAAATRVAAKATATKRVDLKNCIMEEWLVE